jgi:TnpA family transposase
MISKVKCMAKILCLLADVDDKAYCRRILTQFNRGEGHHRLARRIFHGQRVELCQRYGEGQSEQLGALGLVTRLVVLGNTRTWRRGLTILYAAFDKTLFFVPVEISCCSPTAATFWNV